MLRIKAIILAEKIFMTWDRQKFIEKQDSLEKKIINLNSLKLKNFAL